MAAILIASLAKMAATGTTYEAWDSTIVSKFLLNDRLFFKHRHTFRFKGTYFFIQIACCGALDIYTKRLLECSLSDPLYLLIPDKFMA